MSADKGRDILLCTLKSVNSAQVLPAMSEGFKKSLEGIKLTETSDMLKTYRAGIRYTCRIGNNITNIFLEENAWFVEAKNVYILIKALHW